jgi:hypothetical protein
LGIAQRRAAAAISSWLNAEIYPNRLRSAV